MDTVNGVTRLISIIGLVSIKNVKLNKVGIYLCRGVYHTASNHIIAPKQTKTNRKIE